MACSTPTDELVTTNPLTYYYNKQFSQDVWTGTLLQKRVAYCHGDTA